MMRQRNEAGVLAQIASIRALQRIAAEAEAVRAAAALRDSAERERRAEEHCLETERRWRAALAAPAGSMLAPLWAEALLRDDEIRWSQARETRQAENLAARRSGEWNAALMREEVAHDLARAAARQDHRRREEKALQDIADLALQRRRDS